MQQGQVLVLFERSFADRLQHRHPRKHKNGTGTGRRMRSSVSAHVPTLVCGAGQRQTAPVVGDAPEHEISRFAPEGPPWTSDLARASRHAFISFTQVCALNKIGHPDLLCAWAIECDQIWFQKADPNTAAAQD